MAASAKVMLQASRGSASSQHMFFFVFVCVCVCLCLCLCVCVFKTSGICLVFGSNGYPQVRKAWPYKAMLTHNPLVTPSFMMT